MCLVRLGRSLSRLLSIVTLLRDKGVAFRSLTEKWDIKTPSGEFLFQVFDTLAQYERALIQERVLAGLASVHSEFSFKSMLVGRSGGISAGMAPGNGPPGTV